MKKFLVLFLSALLCLSTFGCSKTEKDSFNKYEWNEVIFLEISPKDAKSDIEIFERHRLLTFSSYDLWRYENIENERHNIAGSFAIHTLNHTLLNIHFCNSTLYEISHIYNIVQFRMFIKFTENELIVKYENLYIDPLPDRDICFKDCIFTSHKNCSSHTVSNLSDEQVITYSLSEIMFGYELA